MSAANPVADDLRDEYRALAALCETLTPGQWATPSVFFGWSAWDEVAHLLYFDQTSLAAIHEPDRFVAEARALSARMAAGGHISELARQDFGHLDGPALVALWRTRFEALVDALAPLDPKARLPWYGPPMSARSFATARLMETWAHGQDIWDTLRRRRPGSSRLRHIAHLGVTTLGWTFANRGLPVPEIAPYVELQAPDGDAWTWGDPASEHRVSGSAEDFCLLVTQRRHVDDTALRYSDGPVSQWLHLAQCFAGPPADGPAPGLRRVAYDA
ncbi:MAG: TIGR03084 family metal-binding protein [Rubrivivax sp.]